MRRRAIRQSFWKTLFCSSGDSHVPDYVLISVILFLVLFGLLMLLSASSVLSYEKFQNTYHFFSHQFIFGLIPGLLLFYLCSKIDFKIWKKFAFFMLLISIFLLVIVLIPGIGEDYGKAARSWISIFGFSLQPSEVVKLTFLIYLASWLDGKGLKKIKDFHGGLMPFVILISIIVFLMLLQPDLGTLSIIFLISLISFYVGGGHVKHILMIIGIAGIFFLGAIKFASYRMSRFIAFFNPGADPQGIGYHLNQALIAVGSGGLFGVGLGHSRQKYGYLPEVAGDSIFPIMAEELGFFISVIYVVLIFILVYRGFMIAKNSKTYYGRILAVGISSWIGFQSFLNIGSMLGLVPMTGVPLPFISYGGTAMIMTLAAMGILVNISKHTRV